MNDLTKIAIAVSDSLYNHCEELTLGIKRTDEEGLTVDHPVYDQMNQFLAMIGDPETQQVLEKDWDKFRITRSQHANPRPAVLHGVDLAKWIRCNFDQEELLDEINQVKNESIWSIERTPSDWLRVFAQLNVDISLSTFDRRRKDGRYREREGGSSRSVSLRTSDLPSDYRDSMKAGDVP